jgi:hypothetical protein
MFEAGRIYRFSYLWSWQERQGEETGRKIRPVCLILRTPEPDGALFLFPIATVQPSEDRLALSIPAGERKSAGLEMASWIVLDEYNRTEDCKVCDFESPNLIGQFSGPFFQTILSAIKAAGPGRRIKAVIRT